MMAEYGLASFAPEARGEVRRIRACDREKLTRSSLISAYLRVEHWGYKTLYIISRHTTVWKLHEGYENTTSRGYKTSDIRTKIQSTA